MRDSAPDLLSHRGFTRPALGALAGLLLLAGCVGAEPSEPRLGQEAFDARIARLEQTLLDRCDLQHRSSEESRQQLLELDETVREVGQRLGYLSAEVGRLGRVEPSPAPGCTADELDLGNKMVVGRSEWIGLPQVGTYLKARVDSGANTSSLSATDITPFERDGENWVRFKLALTEEDVAVDDVRDAWVERPVERRVRILQASGDESRPVISLMMTLGPIQEPVEFTLNDRTHLTYPVLLGRRFLMDIAVIDVSEIYLHDRPAFPGGSPPEEAERDEADERGDDEE